MAVQNLATTPSKQPMSDLSQNCNSLRIVDQIELGYNEDLMRFQHAAFHSLNRVFFKVQTFYSQKLRHSINRKKCIRIY